MRRHTGCGSKSQSANRTRATIRLAPASPALPRPNCGLHMRLNAAGFPAQSETMIRHSSREQPLRGSLAFLQCSANVGNSPYCRYFQAPLDRSDMLVDKNRVSIGVFQREAGRPRRVLVGLAQQRDAQGLEITLQLADVGKPRQRLCVAVPTRIEGQGARTFPGKDQ